MRPALRSRSGWTLFEVLLALSLTLVVMAKGALVVRGAMELAAGESVGMYHEDQARVLIDRIALALMGSDRDTLIPQVQGLHSSNIRYSSSLGIQGGVVLWSPSEEIRLVDERAAVEWHQEVDGASRRHAVWTNLVSPLLEGELLNGIDDNGNGLIDEQGLSFVLEDERVLIRLTLRRPGADGSLLQETVEAVVHCRN